MSSHNQVKTYQKGAVLLIFIAALVMSMAWLSYALLGDLGQKLKRQQAQDVGMVLAEAKENLLVFAASEPDLYDSSTGIGHLPCPDFDNNGSPDGNNCNTNLNNVVGRLPHQQTTNYFLFSEYMSKSLDSLSSSKSIWYAISGYSGLTPDFRTVNDGPKPRKVPLNSSVVNTISLKSCGNGIVCLDGKPVVAVLIAAGAPLSTQTGRSSSPTDFRQYLDSSNADNDLYNFVSSFPSNQNCLTGKVTDCFNDKVIAITIEEWVNAMERRVKSEFADLSTTLCSSSWRTTHTTHWAVVNEWYNVTAICPP